MKDLPVPVQKVLDEQSEIKGAYLQLKVINGSYCLYRSTSQWDKDKKKSKKITEYLGVISPAGVFIPKRSRKRMYETSREIYEYGSCALAYSFLLDAEKKLKTLTPYHIELIAISIVKAIDPKPIRLIASRWDKFYLSRSMKARLSPKTVSAVLTEIGRSATTWRELFYGLTSENDFLLYDLTAVFTYSEQLILAERMYNAHHKHVDRMGIVLAFSTSDTLPVGLEVYCGSIKDISTIYDFKARYPASSIGFVFDRGFSSYKLLRELADDDIHYIVPLKKDSKYIDLRWLRWKTSFTYRKRVIRWARRPCDLGYVYFFEDPKIRGEEESSLLKKVEKGKISMKEFEKQRETAGVIGIISDILDDGKEIFDQFKGREDVELAFDAMKNHLASDKTYLRTYESVRGYFLITFLALRVYFKVLRRLREKELKKKISVEEVFMELSKVFKLIEKGGREHFIKVPKRARKIVDLFPEVLPMG